MRKLFFAAVLGIFTLPVYGQSMFNSLFVGVDLNVPVGTYRSGHSPLAQGLPNALHEQKHDPAIGIRLGCEFPIGNGDFATRFMVSYANHAGNHQLETTEGVIHQATTKHQIFGLSGGVMCTPFLSNRHLYLSGDISYDFEMLNVRHSGLTGPEDYDGKRLGLSAGIGHRFMGQSTIWSIEAGLKSTLAGSLDVNGNDYSKRSVLYLSASIHF